jgi:hypothetical protein
VTNAELAQQLLRQANDHMHERRVLLVAATALGTTTSIAAARRALADPEACIPAAVRSAALDLLAELTTTKETT